MNRNLYKYIQIALKIKSVERKSQPILINNDLFPDLLEQAVNDKITTKPAEF
jgi:hypothetical protein